MFSPSSTSIFGRILVATMLAVAGLSLSCGEDDTPPPAPSQFEFGIEVVAFDASENPIPGVPVVLDGNVVGFTGADGKFEGALVDQPTREVELAVKEIDGYRLANDGTNRTTLRVSESLNGELRGIPVSLRAELHSIRTTFVSWVELSCDEHLDDKYCSDRPILLDGKEVARTDYRGAAHFTFEEVPTSTPQITIRTPRYDADDEDSVMMEPRNPSFIMELSHDATIFAIEQEFTDPAARRAAEQAPPPRTRVRRAPRPRAQPAPEPEPEPESESRIRSFFD